MIYKRSNIIFLSFDAFPQKTKRVLSSNYVNRKPEMIMYKDCPRYTQRWLFLSATTANLRGRFKNAREG